jgi:hypothetical protein
MTDATLRLIEITPEMIEAGVKAYSAHWGDVADCLENTPATMVTDVYRAMEIVSSKSHPNDQ